MIICVYVIREQEDTVNDCKSSCNSCIDNLVHSWDEAEIYYSLDHLKD